MKPIATILTFIALFLCINQSQTRAAQPASRPAGQTFQFPSFGVEVQAPSGWTRTEGAVDGSAQVVNFVSHPPQGVGAPELIALEIGAKIGTAPAATLDAWAQSMAKLQNLRIVEVRTQFGDLPAIDLVGEPSKDGTPTLMLCRVCKHADYCYCLWLYSAAAHPDHAPFDEVAKTIKWLPPAAPADSLSNAEHSVRLIEAGMSVNLPDPFRLLDAEAGTLKLNTFDFRVDKTEAKLVVAQVQTPGMAEVETLFVSRLREGARYTGEVKWNDGHGGPPVRFTQPLDLPAQAGEEGRTMQIVVARSIDGKTAVLTFDFPTKLSGPYSKVISERIAQSFRPLPGSATMPRQP